VIAGVLIALGSTQIKDFFETLFENLTKLADKASGNTPA
jgi:pilus assembly protein Flp/PilA